MIEFKPLVRVQNLEDYVPDFYFAAETSPRMDLNYFLIYLKTVPEKNFTLVTVEPGNLQGLLSAISQNFMVRQSSYGKTFFERSEVSSWLKRILLFFVGKFENDQFQSFDLTM